MNEVSQRDIAQILARQANLFRDDSDFLDDLAKQIDPTDAKALSGAPIALARRAIRVWLTETYPPDAATVERVLDVARGATTACEIGMNREVRRSNQRLQSTRSNKFAFTYSRDSCETQTQPEFAVILCYLNVRNNN